MNYVFRCLALMLPTIFLATVDEQCGSPSAGQAGASPNARASADRPQDGAPPTSVPGRQVARGPVGKRPPDDESLEKSSDHVTGRPKGSPDQTADPPARGAGSRRINKSPNEITLLGVHVHFSADPKEYFESAKVWADPPVSASVNPPREADRAAAIPILRGFLSAYSGYLLSFNLTHIYVSDTITIYGRDAEALHGSERIYIPLRPGGMEFDAGWLRARLHAQMFALLFAQYAFPTRPWSSANAEFVKYVGFGAKLEEMQINPNGPQDFSEELIRDGILNKYSLASIEEDASNYVKYLVSDRTWLLRAASRHDRVWRKIQILQKFYQSIDPGFQFDQPRVAPRGVASAARDGLSSQLIDGLPLPNATGLERLKLDPIDKEMVEAKPPSTDDDDDDLSLTIRRVASGGYSVRMDDRRGTTSGETESFDIYNPGGYRTISIRFEPEEPPRPSAVPTAPSTGGSHGGRAKDADGPRKGDDTKTKAKAKTGS